MKTKFYSFLLLLFCCIPLLRGQSQKEYKAYLVSTAHFDTQWNWDVRESIDDFLHRTMVQNFWLFERFPDYIFNFEAAQKYSWMKEYYPADFEKVKAYIKKGRWNVTGSTWEATDPNIPSSESFFRNILYGQEFYKREFGLKTNDIYLPDCFGFGYQLPTIAAHSGLKGFSTQKLQWRKTAFFPNGEKVPFKIGLWQGLDGSRIMGALDTGGYGTAYNYEDVSNDRRIISRAEAGPNKTAYSYYGVGDQGGSPTIPSVYSVEKAVKEGAGPIQVISARAGQIYEDYYPFEKHPELQVYDGELLMDVHGVGCYTSQAIMKRFNRRNEELADAAERASVAAELLGGINYPADELRENWQRFLWHQFHDDITGTSIPRAYTFSWNDELIAQTRFADAITTAVGAVARTLNTQVKGIPVIVYNPVANSRTDFVKAEIPFATQPAGLTVIQPGGKKYPAQLLSYKNGQATVIFPAQTEPVSVSVFEIQTSSAAKSKNLKVSEHSIENAIYKITLDKNGDIGSLIDKRSGTELVEKGKAFRLMVLTDNVSNQYPAWEIYKKTIDGPSSSITDNVKITVAETGPLRASLKIERSWQDSTKIVQYISLTDGAVDDRIDISNEYEWRAMNVLLKAEFPTTVSNEKASYDLGIGYVQRGNNTESAFEVIGRQWADLTSSDGKRGIAILNDCKYGWDKPDNNTIRLTLMHAPKTDRSFPYQNFQDHGHQVFRYAIVSHEHSQTDAGIAAKAEDFNQPLLAFSTPKHTGKSGSSFSLLKSSSPQIAVKAVKKAEHGDFYVIRVNEIAGKDYADANIAFSSPVESAEELNGIEESKGKVRFEGNKIIFSGTKFQPKTFGVKLKSANLLTVPSNTFVDLKYNALALTTDEFNRAGNFDRMQNSFAAELMPDRIVSDGIAFKINNDPAIYNFVRSNGDTILLPEKHGANKLYLLVASTRNDRETTFLVDGKKYTAKIPYYSGFFGQWGWNGFSEGYIKEGSFAYIANHKHSAAKGNDSYNFACLYKICIPIDKDAKALVLPKDPGVALFAVTLTDNRNQDVKPASEMRALPFTTAPIEYTTEAERPERGRMNPYQFDSNGISRRALENYLEKAITMVYFLCPDIPEAKRIYPYPDDDVRMIKNIGAKFIGRSIYRWGKESLISDTAFLNTAANRIKMMHRFDPDIVFQACLFEIITTDVNNVPVPEWVFRDFGLPVEKRNFSYEAMLADNGKLVNHWRENSSVPDISKLETKLWFYFLAGTYINIGCEAFHLGQVELIGMNDPDRTNWASVIAKIREYASKHARRNWVLLDAHVPYGGMVKDGVSLIDFNSFPMRIKEIPEQPYQGKLEVNYLDGLYLKSKGCAAPSGWNCDHLPYLVEFDNFGRSKETNVPTLNAPFVWGWDEISWLSLQPEDYRNDFIRYAYQWLKNTDPDGHLEMPGCRMISCPNESSGSYRANTRSDACPIGYSQEETIKALWSR